MKGYYLFAPVEPQCVGPDSGVERKVRAQHKALSRFVDCELIILPPAEYTGSVSEKIIRRLPFTAAWRKWEYKGEFDGADFVYIRQVYHDASFVRYLRDIKRANPDIKIIYEIPTYPYDPQTNVSVSSLPFVLKDRINRRRAAKYMDAIVTFFGQNEIWGVPCIKTINGYDFSKSELPTRKKGESIEIVSVAATASWHGYDRMIRGLADYYKNGGQENIHYHMIGNVIPEHKALVDNNGLQERVIFCGRMNEEQIADVYSKCFVAINVIGECKGESPFSSSLKSREYGAYGLPFVTSLPVDYVPSDYKYQLLVPRDTTPVDVNAVVEFYHNIYDNADCNKISQEIRSYAITKCDMNITMKPIAEWIEAN